MSSFSVRHHAPFPVVKVGCQMMTVSEWRDRWREVADREGVEVTQSEVDEILAMIE